jgi:hypothetical protein
MAIYKYKYVDVIFISNIFLPSLSVINGNTFDYIFQLGCSSSRNRIFGGDWIHHWTFANEEVWLSLGKEENEYYLKFPDIADFYFSPENKTIDCYGQPDISIETIRHLLLNVVMPLVLTYRGKYFLHVGAIDLKEIGVAFLGKSGFGKSTLTTSFGQKGFPIITDDCVVVEQDQDKFTLMPAPPQLRLWDESIDFLFAQKKPHLSRGVNYTNKAHLYEADAMGIVFSSEIVPLGCIYVLCSPESVEELDTTIDIKRLSSREAMFHLLESVFRFDISDKSRVAQEFDFLSKIARSVPCFHLRYPRNFNLLSEVQSAVVENTLREIKV